MTKPERSLFTRMRRDSDYGGYQQSLVHRDCKVQVRLLAESSDELEALMPAALKFWRGRVRWFKAFRDYAARKLLRQLNGCLDCGQDNPPVITANELKKMLPVPFSVVIERDEDDGEIRFEMSGGRGRRLRGYCIEVVGTLEDGISDGDVVALF